MAQSKNIHAELVNARETFESIWVAIILAFVLRAFVLEAFVIPTGSMAPRLMGEHVLLRCPSCGYEFPYGISFDESVAARNSDITGPPAICPNCRNRVTYSKAEPLSGDRVLVLKYLYKFLPPKTWDVVVFRNPQSNRDNYIKRLVGLPGEELRIVHGDVFKRYLQDFNRDGIKDERDLETPEGKQLPWKIVRKGRETQEAVWQLVFENDYRPTPDSRPTPWRELWQTAGGEAGWRLNLQDGRVFSYDGSSPAEIYFARDRQDIFKPMYGYNGATPEVGDARSNICSDLKLETVVEPKSDQGQITLTLTNIDHQFRGVVNFDGKLTLLHRTIDAAGNATSDWQTWGQTTIAPFRAGQAVPIALTHVDWKVSLLVDGKVRLVTDDEVYKPDVEDLVRRVKLADGGDASAIPTPIVGILADSGQFQLAHTCVMRDVFYTCPTFQFQRMPDPDNYGYRFVTNSIDAAGRAIPGWGTMDSPVVLRQYDGNPDLDEFFMLGDNSPASLDGRLWTTAAATLRLFDKQGEPLYRLGTVPRYNLLGRAFFVYWPAGHHLPGLRLPIVPNVGKMRLIH